ncbi:BTB/POZ domain-containing protein [Ditylenchus destructor]|uniref:BTB/POZ domain-containing protein n=1 Tax=Ditylenchus destructor TaxID=166010 RepID=A0AAD4N043_9BILA|nr:BTB/POZ domain-containing protein [Ditylenchus destructor]
MSETIIIPSDNTPNPENITSGNIVVDTPIPGSNQAPNQPPNPAPSKVWVRLNVGGQVFQTTTETLSRYPESFLDRLVNGGLSSDKDETGAFLIDSDPEYFRTILNYLRSDAVSLDNNEKTLKDLLREADFYNIQPLVDEINKALSTRADEPSEEDSAIILRKLSDMEAIMGSMAETLFGIQQSVSELYRLVNTIYHAMP